MSNEIGRLAQGNVHGVKYTNTINFIHRSEVPPDRKVTYASFVADIKPLKPEPHRIRCVVGGDRLTYDQSTASPTTDLIETKLLINSTISDAKAGARFCSVDLKDFFLATEMSRPEYMKIHISYLPDDIILKYNLREKVHNGYVFVQINKGMYGLRQAAILAHQQLSRHLQKHGYYHIPGTAGLWRHHERKTKIVLCIDDFGVKFYSQLDLDHFLDALKERYEIHLDLQGSNYIGLHLDWDYDNGIVDVSMPHYISKFLKCINHQAPPKPQESPHEHLPYIVGEKGTRQYALLDDNSPKVNQTKQKYVQSVVGSLLYYARAIDPTLLPALSSIATQQSAPTENTMKKVQRILNYVSSFPDRYLRYRASNMQLHIDSDASYLVESRARSRVAGFYYFKHTPTNQIQTPMNHPLLVECRLLRHVVTSAAEAEVSALFHNAQVGLILRRLLCHLQHPQFPTPLKTDNTTAANFASNTITQKRSKTWDMRFYWLKNQEAKSNFNIFWKRGDDACDPNHADYFTKHHTTAHHRSVQNRYVSDKKPTKNRHTDLRGCVNKEKKSSPTNF